MMNLRPNSTIDQGFSIFFMALGIFGVLSVFVMGMQSSHQIARSASAQTQVVKPTQIVELGN